MRVYFADLARVPTRARKELGDQDLTMHANPQKALPRPVSFPWCERPYATVSGDALAMALPRKMIKQLSPPKLR